MAALAVAQTAILGGLSDIDALAGAGGEIQILIYHEPWYLEFTVEPNGLIDYRQEEGDKQTEDLDDLTLEDAVAVLGDFLKTKVWLSLDSSRAITTSIVRGALAVSLSKTTMRLGFRSSTWTAPKEPILQFAGT